MLISLLGVHHNYWKDSERFDQNRFLPGGEYDQFPDEMRPFMFVPFSAGPRNCLGQYLSLVRRGDASWRIVGGIGACQVIVHGVWCGQALCLARISP